MKKSISVLAVILLIVSLAGCTRSMNYVIEHEPSFVGKVEMVAEDYVLVNVNTDDALYSDYPNVQVSLAVELSDSFLSLSIGDEIVVYYDGNITEGKAETVYAINLRTPANRETQYVAEHEPSFVGKIEMVAEDYVLVNVNTDDALYSDYPNVQVSLAAELSDGYFDFSIGDEIVVYYNGNIIDGKTEIVYAITLKTPANRETQ